MHGLPVETAQKWKIELKFPCHHETGKITLWVLSAAKKAIFNKREPIFFQ